MLAHSSSALSNTTEPARDSAEISSGRLKPRLRCPPGNRARCVAAISCLHHLFNAGSFRPAEAREHTLLLGDILALWFFSLNRRFVGAMRGLRDNRGQRLLGDDRSGHALTPPWRRGFGLPLFGCGTLEIPRFFDGKGQHSLGLLWFAAPEWTPARPKAQQIAGRALIAPAGREVGRATPIAMRTPRQKSSRFCVLKSDCS
jgi:hypothetical protein